MNYQYITTNFRPSKISFGFSDDNTKNESKSAESRSVLNVVTYDKGTRYFSGIYKSNSNYINI